MKIDRWRCFETCSFLLMGFIPIFCLASVIHINKSVFYLVHRLAKLCSPYDTMWDNTVQEARKCPTEDIEMSPILYKYQSKENVWRPYAFTEVCSTATPTMTETQNVRPALIQLIQNTRSLQQFQHFLLETWQFADRAGKDSIGLDHTWLNIKEIFKINNDVSSKCYYLERAKLRKKMTGYQEITTPIIISDFGDDEERPLLTTGRVPSLILDNDPLDASVNEGYLFHGTKREYVSKIAREGLKVSAGGLYGGSAVYSAESVEKADQYADLRHNREKHDLVVLVVRVLLGECYVEKPGQRINGQPKKPCENDQCPCDVKYDSVVAGHGKRFREFLVYNPHMCLPQFMVVYDRMKVTKI